MTSQNETSRKRIALVTDDAHPLLSDSDRQLIVPLAESGLDAEVVSWQTPGVDWGAFDAVVLRACWNYHAHVEAYRAWLDLLDVQRARVWNSTGVARWNMDKIYLRDLSEHGVVIPKTVWLERGARVRLRDMLTQRRWTSAVVKPRVGASAYNIWRVSAADAGTDDVEARFADMCAERPVLVQQFLPEIAQGEWSLVFFRGEFSHAVLKTPSGGDIFVQKRLGGTTRPAQPPAGTIRQAHDALVAAAQCVGLPIKALLYARVDAIPVNGVLHLVELEVMEPGLFLDLCAPDAAQHFAEAIRQGVAQVRDQKEQTT